MITVDATFFDMQLYALYRAIWEKWGEDAWHVVWRSGEILFEEIEPELALAEHNDPFLAMEWLADYLQRAGHVQETTVQQRSGSEWEYTMHDRVILPSAQRFLADGALPAHVSMTLKFALLNSRFGLSAEMVEDPDLPPDGYAAERWRLLRSGTRKAP